MGSVNSVFLMGNLTSDPALRHTPSGMAVTDLRLAISDNYRNKEVAEVQSTCFIDAGVWGAQAENCVKYTAKGSAVMVEGRLQFDQWETPQGEKRSKHRVRAARVQFLGPIKEKTAEDRPEARMAAVEADEDGIPF